jgi:hypothetical protein
VHHSSRLRTTCRHSLAPRFSSVCSLALEPTSSPYPFLRKNKENPVDLHSSSLEQVPFYQPRSRSALPQLDEAGRRKCVLDEGDFGSALEIEIEVESQGWP